jgi:hypothetical protein
VIEGPGAASGTFRIESTGTSGGAKRSIVATFAHPGFTNYVYFSNYEVEDPTTFEPEPVNCEHYYKYRVEHKLTEECEPIQFAAKDKVNGPLHTNDAADLCAESTSKPTFGRNTEDSIEMNGGHYSEGTCGNSYNMLGTYTEKGQTLLPPSTDNELLESAGYKFKGKTTIVLKAGVSGNQDTMTVTTEGKTLPAKVFPANGVVYVENAEATCNIKYTPFGTDYENDGSCGNVYVSGSYTEPLTIAAANDVIINGSITTTSVPATGKPTGSGTLGLIATNFVRIYHPVKQGYAPESNAPEHPLQAPINKKCIKSVKTVTAKLTTSSTTITNVSSTSGLEAGDEVTGTNIPTGTTIVSKASTTIVLSKKPTANVTSESLTIYRATGYEYYSGIEKCVEPAPNNFTYDEAENLFVEECESGTTAVGTTFCKYENSPKTCSKKATNLTGSMSSPTIDAAILSTHHSFIVDNFKCGAQLGELNVWGSIAQFWRGPVGTGGSSTGYIKNYNYDDRLATAQPPEFLSSTTSWRLSRETAPPSNFG